jgi:DNA (cytosine-5)-methyltransferase 1
MNRPRLLDLFCGAGGCSVGYEQAGFDVTGVDIAPQHRYPFLGIEQADALDVLADVAYCREFDVIHASPPCQSYTVARSIHQDDDWRYRYRDLVAPVRDALHRVGQPFVIENVVGAPLISAGLLCGQSFGLGVFRHRLFETNWPMQVPRHLPHEGAVGDGRFFTVAGHGGGRSIRDGIELGDLADWSTAMGIDWMNRDELAQAIPPAYCEFIGGLLLARLAVAS